LVEAAIASLLLKNPKSRAEAISLLVRSPSVALSASKYISKSRDPSLKALDRGDMEAAVRLNLDGIEDKANSLELFPENARKMMLDNGRTVREGGLAYPTVTREDLSKVTSPALVINGETSALWLRRIGEITATSMPGCEKARISKTGHFPHIQNPEEFNKQLLGFLQRHSSF
jgi:pimeloyl-ACP methyl ester carboxylesterase